MTPIEQSKVAFGKTLIPYRIRRSHRRKTVAVAVDPGQGVLLTAPEDVPIKRLDKVVRQKAPWIVDRLRLMDQTEPPLPTRQYVSGESYLYLGRNYRLKVTPTGKPGPCKLQRGWLVVNGNRDQQAIRRALIEWYRQHARMRLAERVERYYRRLHVRRAPVLIRSQQKRWASCDEQGQLRFNWRVIQAPMRLVDYVVVHELAHLRHREHDQAFWALVGRVLPDYEERRETLRRLGVRLLW